MGAHIQATPGHPLARKLAETSARRDLEWQTPVSALRQSIIDVVIIARFRDKDMPLGFQPGR